MAFDLRTASGLDPAVAERRLVDEGPNELPSAKKPSLLATVVQVLKEPMLLLLVAAGVIYLLLGSLEEALVLLFAVFAVIGITIVQERRTERALDALRSLSSPRARVIRGGQEHRIPGSEVVRGDLVLLAEGDRVPADARLLESANLLADESLLTGESVPVRKVSAARGGHAGTAPSPGGDDQPYVYSGTLVVRGHGAAEVLSTGLNTAIGRIGKVLATVEVQRTPLQTQVRRLVRVLAIAGVSLSAVLVVIYGLTRGDWLEGFLAGVAVAMSLLPEEFPVVLTIFLALGAWRLSKSRVLTRHAPAVETLGSATVLCVDKTGTLTRNEMSVAELWVPEGGELEVEGETQKLPEAFHAIVELGVLASQRDPFDPMEVAFHRLAGAALGGTEHLHPDWELEREYPLSPELLAMSHVWRAPDGSRRAIAAKGAPEAIADLCHLDDSATEALRARVSHMASRGLRVLAVARADFEGELPREQHDIDFELKGLVGLLDPVRPGVPEAVAECQRAGLRVIMITGDYPETARAIAKDAGLKEPHDVITGKELEGMDDETLQSRVRSVSIFARAVPEQKLRLVNALRKDGHIVAMTGDGVNDAPALRAAHIGVAMGGRGTDVAREAASLVVTDDDFTSIVAGVRIGRRIFDNLQKSMAYLLAVHVTIAGVALLPVLVGWPLVLMPVHIVFLELVIDPACSIAFEAEPAEKNVMRRPPRSASAPLFGLRLLVISLLQGGSVFLANALIFAWAMSQGMPAMDARALVFAALIAGNLMLILVNRSWTRTAVGSLFVWNPPALAVLVGALVVLFVAIYAPPVRGLFDFGAVPFADVGIAIAAGAVSVVWFDLVKLLWPAALKKAATGGRE